MKQLIFTLSIILAFTFSSSAQEKQNDATLEETINWIKEHAIDNIDHRGYGENRVKNVRNFNYDPKKSEFSITWEIYSGQIDDFYLNKSSDSDKFRLTVYKSQQRGVYFVEVAGKGVFGFSFPYKEKEFALRVYKAFEHLFYLLEWEVECENKTVSENKF